MKKIVLFFLCIYTALQMNAQQTANDVGRFYAGFHSGYNNSSIKNQSIYNQNNSGFLVGVDLSYALNKYFSLRAELNYEMKSAQGQITYYNSIGEQTLSYTKSQYLHYANIPVLAKIYLFNKDFKVFASTGLYDGYLIEAWVNPQDIGTSHDVTNDYLRNDFGFIYGAGLQYNIANNYTLTAEWRNTLGLTNISATASNYYNRTTIIQAGVAYKLFAKK
ncbi:MAG: porin family protein [Bacteroidota bacterium]